jgi:class 3 adenylate cyclase
VQVESAIAALQAQRAVLGDGLIDAAPVPLLERLAAMATLSAPSTLPERSEPTERACRLRQVSVMLLDIVGSTQLVQLLNPEEMQMTASGALADFTAIISHRGGELLLDAGDKLKAAFGACDVGADLNLSPGGSDFGRRQQIVFPPNNLATTAPSLLDGHALGQIAWLVHIRAARAGGVVCQQLQRHHMQDR